MPAPAAIGLIARLLLALRAGRAGWTAAGIGRSASAAGRRAAGAAAPRAAQAGAEAAPKPGWFSRGLRAAASPEHIVPMTLSTPLSMGLYSMFDSMGGDGEVPAGMPSMDDLARLEQIEGDPDMSDLLPRRSMNPIHR